LRVAANWSTGDACGDGCVAVRSVGFEFEFAAGVLNELFELLQAIRKSAKTAQRVASFTNLKRFLRLLGLMAIAERV
jgi:hypothetical protein